MPQTGDFKWDGIVASKEVRAAAARGLKLWANLSLQVSNDRVPLDEGTLMRSGTPSVDPNNLIGAVSYDTPYAVDVHEIIRPHPGGRQSKYLETAMADTRGQGLALVAKQLRKALGG